MIRSEMHDVACSLARGMDVLGDAWVWLIVRDLSLGIGRFDRLLEDLGISRKVLAERLAMLVERGIVVTEEYSSSPARHDYLLTAKGVALVPVIAALAAWGDRWDGLAAGAPMYIEHAGCSGSELQQRCSDCGAQVDGGDLVVRPGPGGRRGKGTAVVGPLLAGARDTGVPVVWQGSGS
jgi:DNA-binding HxlR family transcriptional regulator